MKNDIPSTALGAGAGASCAIAGAAASQAATMKGAEHPRSIRRKNRVT
jgi:hypothetical protein